MHSFFKRSVFGFALLMFSLSCNQLQSSTPQIQKPQEALKVVPTLFKLNCRTVLNPASSPINLTVASQVFSVPDFSTGTARISMTIGPFTLISKVIEEAREHESVKPPAFCVDLYNGNFSEPARCEKGFDLTELFNGRMGLPLSSGMGFILILLTKIKKFLI